MKACGEGNLRRSRIVIRRLIFHKPIRQAAESILDELLAKMLILLPVAGFIIPYHALSDNLFLTVTYAMSRLSGQWVKNVTGSEQAACSTTAKTHSAITHGISLEMGEELNAKSTLSPTALSH